VQFLRESLGLANKRKAFFIVGKISYEFEHQKYRKQKCFKVTL